MYTRGQWASALLSYLGNPSPNTQILDFVIGWTSAEIAPPPAASPMYNLLATTQHETGSTNYNSVGVQNFTSFMDGIKANGDTIRNGWYTHLAEALSKNDPSQLYPQPSSFIIQDMSMWTHGNYTSDVSQYIYNIYHQDYIKRAAESFPGDLPTPPAPQPNIAATQPILENMEKEIEAIETALNIQEPSEGLPVSFITRASTVSEPNSATVVAESWSPEPTVKPTVDQSTNIIIPNVV